MTSSGDDCVTFEAAREQSSEVIAELTIPARYRHVRLARLLAGGVAAQLGLDVDRVEEFRLTVDELCAVLLECAVSPDGSDDDITVTFEADPAGVAVTVRRPAATMVDQPSPITAAILDSTCSEWDVSDSFLRATLRTRAVLHVHR